MTQTVRNDLGTKWPGYEMTGYQTFLLYFWTKNTLEDQNLTSGCLSKWPGVEIRHIGNHFVQICYWRLVLVSRAKYEAH